MSALLARRRFIQLAGIPEGLALAIGVGAFLAVRREHPEEPATSSQEALDLLLAGNRRWANGTTRHPHLSRARMHAVAQRQTPFAIVFSCIDSRVPSELVFDRGLGDILVVRTGAHVMDEATLGSLEFGLTRMETPLIVVLGHGSCGAVLAAIETIRSNRVAPGRIGFLVEALKPAYEEAVRAPGDLVDNMVVAHTELTVEWLKRDRLFAERIQAGKLMIVGGRYDLGTGAVEIIA